MKAQHGGQIPKKHISCVHDTNRKSLLTMLSRNNGNLMKQEEKFKTYTLRCPLSIWVSF